MLKYSREMISRYFSGLKSIKWMSQSGFSAMDKKMHFIGYHTYGCSLSTRFNWNWQLQPSGINEALCFRPCFDQQDTFKHSRCVIHPTATFVPNWWFLHATCTSMMRLNRNDKTEAERQSIQRHLNSMRFLPIKSRKCAKIAANGI